MSEPTETTAAPETTTDSSSTSDDGGRADLIAVAQEAVASEAAADAPTPKEPKKAVEAALAPEEKPITAVAKAIREAKERQKQRVSERQQFDDHAARLEQQQHAFAQREAEFERKSREVEAKEARFLEAQRDISKYAEFSGKSQEAIAQELMIQGSPEHQALVRQQARLEALESQLTQQKNAWEQHQTNLKQQEAHANQARQEHLERSFVNHSSQADTYPNFAKLPPAVRLNWGYEIAAEYFQATKRIASDSEIAEYIETSLSGETAGQNASHSKAANGKAPTSRANGPRTLSNSVASERRSTPKSTSTDLSPEELRKELIAVAKEASMTST